MDWITDLDHLHSLYGTPKAPALRKVSHQLTPAYHDFIAASRFCLLSTVGPEGVDGSPRGDAGPVVQVLNTRTLALPDWRGNDRIDSLRNILRDGRVALYFMVAGASLSVRVNGRARLTDDMTLRQRFVREGQLPRTVIVIAIEEVYAQCARALHRSALWTSGDCSQGLPTLGQMLQEASEGDIDGADYDRGSAARAHLGWW